MRRRRHTDDRDNVCEKGIGEDPATNNIEEIDQTAVTEVGRDPNPFFLVDPTLGLFVCHQTEADQKIGPDAFADLGQDVDGEPHPVFERAVVVAVYLVNERRSETVKEMAVAL